MRLKKRISAKVDRHFHDASFAAKGMKEIMGIFLRDHREVAACSPFRGSALLAHALQGQIGAALLVVSLAIPAGAQTTKQVWPELSAYVKLI
jgi:hypothetical protein